MNYPRLLTILKENSNNANKMFIKSKHNGKK